METAILSLNHQQGSQSDCREVSQFFRIEFVHDESSGPKIMVTLTNSRASSVSFVRILLHIARIDADCLGHSGELERVRQGIKKPLITFIPDAVCNVQMKYRGGVRLRISGRNKINSYIATHQKISPRRTISHEFDLLLLMPRILTQMRFIFGLAAIVCLPFCMSCSTPLPPPSETEQETADAALEILSQSQTDEILNAFDEIASWSYTRHDRTENRTAREYESFTRLVKVDTSGSVTVVVGSDSVAALDLSGLAEAMMPDDVPYLMERFKDEFSYQIREDITYWTRPAYEITVQARLGSAQEGVTASYMYDTASNKLISANLHNFSSTILFGESSRYLLQLRPIGTAWVPYRLSAHVTLKLPLGQEQIFARNVTFYNYTARSTN